ncbi:bifunctional ADP-dependent NAD(P)H-hydrate dehydratase/NAD(P)H-hydrate epimerase [Verminephrobacter eiseniae]|uniref:Bifunctional NAD(P)H-hydrate repair enzyme n=1 Tax=Verminephrobacter eiseniae (strain EF01-2) TaxID=391735 RepID=A1WHT0_VEREI|nr:bifunctional ADP-dependent NAD(P)H-hydrate dehydratase/NAD(P)H-hydrate epimerase [Verminephrobacter eiseniae]ABM57187.1 carbohydrate kinase, YjeF related protein [Verminephrobacter eiseniae EF01-2]MCW5282815.1 bifunctional ADP-dependent NAD(P)H-hydrate dehydratase/NAD(P)H-hydrate epimerase [Verminephrobacter eiseniae]MCW5303131.1 bifunctional ADP-dependent NAD(P)H-hydrate dehydratase/NAD(P)H-hydrate epimerase [Verminephrobacter eiseniae]MCW8181344.1 bifunctional ADP-dependent NAD(P)H-hydrate
MHRITPHQPHPLFDSAATGRIERAAAATLPAHQLMQRAGLAVAQLAQALAPYARTVWLACGPGNNGGDGLEAAMHLQRNGRQAVVTWLGQPDKAPADARASWLRAQAAGVQWADHAPDQLSSCDLCIDALLGLGVSASSSRAMDPAHAMNAPARTIDPRLRACLSMLRHSLAPVLAVDLPSGLDADTGQYAPGLAPDPGPPPGPARYTLSLLSLKPGLFTAAGRDAVGQLWFDDLGVAPGPEPPSAWLSGPALAAPRAHASHKGSYGDVAVVGGEGLAERGLGMTGAALLAASAALHSGAGRVLVALLDDGQLPLDPQQPELMLRRFEALALERLTVVCGCGGGQSVGQRLPEVITRAARLVLDADALNHIAGHAALQALVLARGQQGRPTVLTPHPLEAARLLGLSTAQVQADRLGAARQLATRFAAVAVLKGSGSVIAAPGQTPAINPTGNALLASAGTGDVLAGMVGARLAAGASPLNAACDAVYAHGRAADAWPAGQALTAGELARRLGR